VATEVNKDGKREMIGIDVGRREDAECWLAFLRSLVARGLTEPTGALANEKSARVRPLSGHNQPY
jgi:transposase-like protein